MYLFIICTEYESAVGQKQFDKVKSTVVPWLESLNTSTPEIAEGFAAEAAVAPVLGVVPTEAGAYKCRKYRKS